MNHYQNKESFQHDMTRLPFLSLNTPSKTEKINALFLFVFVLALIFFNALIHSGTHYIGGVHGDAGLYIWLFKTNLFNLFNNEWFSTNAFYPYGQSLAFSDNFILPSLLFYPLSKAGLPVSLCYNLAILSALFLNAFCTYLLAYFLTAQQKPSLASGIFMLTPVFLFAQLGHPQLQFAFWIPLCLLFFFKFLARPSIKYSLFSALCIVGSFLCAVYYSVFCALALCVITFFLILLRPVKSTFVILRRFYQWFPLPLLLLIPFLVPYLNVKASFGARGIHESFFFAANGLSFLASAPVSFMYSSLSALSPNPEAFFFPGFIILLVSGVAFFRLFPHKKLKLSFLCFIISLLLTIMLSTCPQALVHENNNSSLQISCQNIKYINVSYLLYATSFFSWVSIISFCVHVFMLGRFERKLGFSIITNRDLLAIIFGLGLFSFIISLGPMGFDKTLAYPSGLFSVLYHLFPGMDSLRAIARLNIVTLFSLGICFAFGLTFLKGMLPASEKLFGLIASLVILENLVSVYPLEPLQNVPLSIKQLDTLVKNDPPNRLAAALVLPFVPEVNTDGTIKSWKDFAILNVRAMNWLGGSKLKILNGYSGQRTKLMEEIAKATKDFPDNHSIEFMQKVPGLKYIIFSSRDVVRFDPLQFLEKVSKTEALKPIMVDDEGNYLFSFNPSISVNSNSFWYIPPLKNIRLEIDEVSENKNKFFDANIFIEPPKTLLGNITSSSHFLRTSPGIPRNRVKPRKLTVGEKNNRLFKIKNIEVTF